MDAKTPGQIAYEQDCEWCPTFHDGGKRTPWERLPDYIRQTWDRDPTPREWVKGRAVALARQPGAGEGR